MIQYFDADRSSLYDAIQTLMSGAITGKLVSDRQGKLWAERDVWVEPTAFETGFTIEKQDWMGDPQIDETSTKKVSYLEAGGVAYDGTSYTALLAAAPGSAPGYRGKVERIQGLALDSQSELNQITGDLFAQMNVKYSAVELTMAGSYRNFDIAPQEKYPMTVGAADTVRGISFSGLSFYPETLRYTFMPKEERLMSIITFQQIASGADAETMVIPVTPTEDSSEYTVPGISLPAINFPPFPSISIGGGGRVEFTPCMYGYLGLTRIDHSNAGAVNSASLYPGLQLSSSSDVLIYGIFRVPTDYSGTILVQFFYSASNAGSGDVYIIETARNIHFVAGASVVTPTNGVYHTEAINYDGDAWGLYYLANGISFDVSGGDVVSLTVGRQGSMPQDTYDQYIHGLGWFITYA